MKINERAYRLPGAEALKVPLSDGVIQLRGAGGGTRESHVTPVRGGVTWTTSANKMAE